MSIRPIIQLGDEKLKIASKAIEPSDITKPEIKNLITDLIDTMFNEPDSAGISAPQIGVNLRVFIINNQIFNQETSQKFSAFINPEIKKFSSKKETEEEGCLSIRWVYGLVERPKQITVKYYDEKGNLQNRGFGGFQARVIQHEIDHLNGVLFIDKATKIHKLSDQEIIDLKKSWENEKQ